MSDLESAKALFLKSLNRLQTQDYLGAEVDLRAADALVPDRPSVLTNLSACLIAQGRYREAQSLAERAIALEPANSEALTNLGACRIGARDYVGALRAFGHALTLAPDYAPAHDGKGNALMELWRLADAEASVRRALQLDPQSAKFYSTLGTILQNQGRLAEAEATFRTALRLDPQFEQAQSKLLLSHNYNPDVPAAQCLADARRYGEILARRVTHRFTDYACEPAPNRLRVGLVSGDLWSHPVGYFLEGVVRHINPDRIELRAYVTDSIADALTARLKPRFAAWTELLGIDIDEAARRIHSDGVHVLIDLAGHTGKNGLPVLARKPAPVQASWLGYFATTGVGEIDYFIGDPHSLPVSLDNQFTESVWRLPETRMCFTSPAEDIPVSPLPSLKNGYITFACFNNLCKMNERVVDLWAKTLASTPASRLFLKCAQLGEPGVPDAIVRCFVARGIDASRLRLESASPRGEYLRAYHEVDVCLDPFPFTGATTIAEALWMGVPSISLAGDRLVSRQGAGLLQNAGLGDWIAHSTDHYLERAVANTRDLVSLAELREGLRTRLPTSPAFDAARFARHFEEALWGMWREAGIRFLHARAREQAGA